MRTRLRVECLIAIWFAASVVAVQTAKHTLRALPCPGLLSTIQFCVAIAGTWLALKPSDRRSLTGLACLTTVRAISLAYASGFVLTNAAIATATPSFVETLKSSEPISTVLFAGLILGDREHSITLATLVPIVLGVAMACKGDGIYSTAGAVLALASNLAFSLRAVLTKLLKRKHVSVLVAKYDMVLFYHITRCGLWLLVPITLLLDAGSLRKVLVSGTDDGSSTSQVCIMLLVNGFFHALYNAMSFLVLAKVSITTHAVLNIIRRVLVIAVSATMFATPISSFNWFGIFLAVMGINCFALSRSSYRHAHGTIVAHVRTRHNELPV